MSSFAPRRSPASQPHPLIAHRCADEVVAYRRGEPVTAARFLRDVRLLAEALPDSRHVLNFCSDRYRFTVVLCAAIVRGQTTLLPPTTTPNVIRAMGAFAADAYHVTDDPKNAVDMPRFELPDFELRPMESRPLGVDASADFTIPRIPGEQVAACVFTSGSTGEPQPHFKSWGGLVLDVQGEARRLGIGPGHSILGTVPPQHMYGFESTVLLPLLAGAALTSERLYFPADIDTAIRRVPSPRTMFTTPFHLRAWMDGGDAAAIETLVSATAPLSVGLAREAEERTGAKLFEIYGCTEAGQVATRRPTGCAEWEALEGLRLWNEGAQAMVSGGHVERPTPLGDIIEVHGDGTRFLLHGRTADMVNIAGKRNSIGYLDHQLTSIPGVTDGAFFLPDEGEPDGVTRLMAFVAAPELGAAEILAALRSRIDPAFMPRPLVLVDSLPRQLTGKLPREALRALAATARRHPAGEA
jgi:acyl-coenzyme A synthetase/AMP-(fatty) acid ligase